jgi:hypothetical protein
MTSRPWEHAREWSPPDGWSLGTKKHGGHACGWTCVHDFADPAGFTAKIRAHDEQCPWPDDFAPVETVSD